MANSEELAGWASLSRIEQVIRRQEKQYVSTGEEHTAVQRNFLPQLSNTEGVQSPSQVNDHLMVPVDKVKSLCMAISSVFCAAFVM